MSPEQDDELAVLPERYATALRLARTGATPTRIADDLEIPVESVAALLVLAEAKLDTATRRLARAKPGTDPPAEAGPPAATTAKSDDFPET